ncbi:hypothetical protein FOLKNPGA_03432 [Legionella sp. PC1000]|uniref:protein kinase domain-containing protein n=1 Tax=Legionella sp. PC1000 TaxID=2746060 RepID=UPI0015FD62E5|nr:protein kinase [Legionella sp. PC1000]QLZ70618.1 hypothetical protein FOLKNPGA_03432 [Legionella sp. PC1000]
MSNETKLKDVIWGVLRIPQQCPSNRCLFYIYTILILTTIYYSEVKMKSFFSKHKAGQIITIPNVPFTVDVDRLQSNNRLLSNDEISRLEKMNLSRGHHHKHETNTPYTIIAGNDALYAVYYGKKANAHLGEGAYGLVKVGQNLKTGKWIVLKINESYAKDTEIQNELGILKARTHKAHPNAVQYYERESTKRKAKDPSGEGVVREFFMPYESGILLRHLLKKTSLSQAMKLNIAEKIILKLDELHRKGIEHNDIKSDNIICDIHNMDIKLIDFGKSKPNTRISQNSKDFSRLSELLAQLLGEEYRPSINEALNSKKPLKQLASYIKEEKENLNTINKIHIVGVLDLAQVDENNLDQYLPQLEKFSNILLVDSNNELILPGKNGHLTKLPF